MFFRRILLLQKLETKYLPLVVAAATVPSAFSSPLSLNNMEELLMVERGSFHNMPEVVKLELCTNPLLSYIDPQAFRSVRPARCIWTPPTVGPQFRQQQQRLFFFLR